ncbi:biotin/lipoyl-binding protein [Alicyclobacillaceae bacterium I2511]|nr:biotin/lipoyl-binding protein [Alicyclobacillaceae bacterium I2511]
MATITATMAGTVLSLTVVEGAQIAAGQDVAVLESMKMEIPILSDFGGRVKRVWVTEGQFVNEGDPLLDVEE